MNTKHAQIVTAITLALAIAACGGRSAKHSAATSPASESRQCRDRVSSESGDAAAPASADSCGDYDYDDSCYGMEAGPVADSSAEGEITRLWNEIREARLEAGLPGEPLASDTSKVQPLSVEEIQSEEDHAEPTSQKCIDTCKIEDSICKNADSICRLADSLGGNEWALEKCNSGKASCQEANKKCAECVASEATTLTP